MTSLTHWLFRSTIYFSFQVVGNFPDVFSFINIYLVNALILSFPDNAFMTPKGMCWGTVSRGLTRKTLCTLTDACAYLYFNMSLIYLTGIYRGPSLSQTLETVVNNKKEIFMELEVYRGRWIVLQEWEK